MCSSSDSVALRIGRPFINLDIFVSSFRFKGRAGARQGETPLALFKARRGCWGRGGLAVGVAVGLNSEPHPAPRKQDATGAG